MEGVCICVGCQKVTVDTYWVDPATGQKSKVPYCPPCYEDAARRANRDLALKKVERAMLYLRV